MTAHHLMHRIVVVLLASSTCRGWQNLPAIPANRRVEYYLLHDDGAYKFGYDTGDGSSAVVSADPANQVEGQYSYIDNLGQPHSLSYTSGDGGFIPHSVSGHAGGSGAGRGRVSAASNGVAAPSSGSDVNADYDANADASYSFSIDTDSYKRTESADARGNVRGQYSYSSGAGGDTGFVVTSSDGSAAAPGSRVSGTAAGQASDIQGGLNPDGSYSFSYSTADQSRQETADANNNVRGSFSFKAKDDGQVRRVDYEAGAPTGFLAKGAHLPVPPAVPGTSAYSQAEASPNSGTPSDDESAPGDASYSFSYDAGDHSRQEVSDSRGNVKGQFAFVAKDGVQRRVEYEAGAEKGFIAKGAHLPVAAADGGTNVPGEASSYSAPQSDGAYSFGYSVDDHSRQESADAQNNVRGSFSFRAKDDGKLRKVDYEAGAATGFIARGDHLPVAPSVTDSGAAASYSGVGDQSSGNTAGPSSYSSSAPASDGSYSFAYSAADHSRQESADAQNNVRGSFSFRAKDDGKLRKVDYEAGAATGFVARGDHLPVAPSATSSATATGYSDSGAASSAASAGPTSYSSSGPASDGSYSFAYSAADHSRQESADAQNNVRGSFSFRAKDDGKLRRVDYEAGAATGFIARGDHLPVAPSVASSGAATGYSAPGATPSASSSGTTSYSSSGPASDGSYSFSYSTADQSREEYADAQNNVRGSYSFKAKDDGKLRRVDYEAGAATGFIARGDHLPLAPSVASSGAPTGYSAPGATPSASSSGPTSYSSSGPASDGSYSFSYSTADQSREEYADAQNNVRGSYSFKAKDDGKLRRVDYEAGAATGFIARGDHLPVAPSTTDSGAPASYSGVGGESPGNAVGSSSYSSSGPGADGSYSFSYSAADHSRQESADAQNVRGSFSFRAKDDGKLRRLDYEAGAATGFIARGDHLPVASSVVSPGAATAYSGAAQSAVPATSYSSSGPAADGSYSFSYSAADHSREESGDAQNNVRGSYSFVAKDDGQRRRVDYVAGADTGFLAKGAHLPVPPAVAPSVVGVIPKPVVYSGAAGAAGDAAAVDGSYSFAYDAGDHSREESADTRGNVRGSFSFVAKDDGVRRRVDYEAGAEKGFIAKGAHLPVAPAVVAAPAGSYQAVGSEQDSGDASYSYSYETDSSSKQESSDAAGNVRGHFSFLGGDGRSRTVQYTSRGDEGFLATGEHLPVAPVASSVPAGSAAVAVKKVHDLATSSFVVHRFLPPESTHKFGYIFDTKV